MRVFQINGGVFGSTGKIMFGIARVAREQGYTVRCASAVTSTNRNREPEEAYYKIGTYFGRCVSVFLARITGLEGCFAFLSTWKLIREMKRFAPDVVHLHSIHNSYLNIPMLFRYLKKSGVKVIWTLHDCWAFTGHCPHFEMVGCDKWKDGCHSCPLYREYPKSYGDNAKVMYRLKKRWFTGLRDLTVVTPSHWLSDMAKQSFLKGYPVRVIHNGIDLEVFRPTESDFRRKYHCENKTVLLGVAFGWGPRKGLDVFVELAKRLDDSYQIVLVGTDEAVEQQLPKNIISIRRTQNQKELAEIYTAADVFVNPTREDTYPTVNMEAIACGTPVITFATGGSPESLDVRCGCVVEKNCVRNIYLAIDALVTKENDCREYCIDRAKQFDLQSCYKDIVSLYDEKLQSCNE